MKKAIAILAVLILPNLWMFWVINSVQPVYNTYNQSIVEREQASLNMPIPDYTVTRTFLLNHTDGTPVKFHLVKFECCNRIGGMVKDGELYMGYLNEVQAKQLGTTSLQMVPEVEISILIHELFHLGSMHVVNYCSDFSTSLCQEKGAYNVEYLYEQIRSLGEDGFLRLNK